MLKFYRTYFHTYNKGHLIGTHSGKTLANEDEKPKEETIEFTWENLQSLYSKYGILTSFSLWNFKKGRIISFFTDSLIFVKPWEKDIKEWKEKELDLTLQISVEEYMPSIQEVLNWYDSEKAIQYLKERGLSVKEQA